MRVSGEEAEVLPHAFWRGGGRGSPPHTHFLAPREKGISRETEIERERVREGEIGARKQGVALLLRTVRRLVMSCNSAFHTCPIYTRNCVSQSSSLVSSDLVSFPNLFQPPLQRPTPQKPCRDPMSVRLYPPLSYQVPARPPSSLLCSTWREPWAGQWHVLAAYLPMERQIRSGLAPTTV